MLCTIKKYSRLIACLRQCTHHRNYKPYDTNVDTNKQRKRPFPDQWPIPINKRWYLICTCYYNVTNFHYLFILKVYKKNKINKQSDKTGNNNYLFETGRTSVILTIAFTIIHENIVCFVIWLSINHDHHVDAATAAGRGICICIIATIV